MSKKVTPLFTEEQPEPDKNILLDFPTVARQAQRFPIKNSQNADLFPDTGELNYAPSETIPDVTLSIREIMDRYARGIPFDNVKTPVYNGEAEFPNLQHMDLADREAYILEREAELRTLKQTLKEAYDENQRRQIEAARQAEQDRLAQQRAQEQGLPPGQPV